MEQVAAEKDNPVPMETEEGVVDVQAETLPSEKYIDFESYEWNFDSSDDDEDNLKWIPEGPVFKATMEQMKTAETLFKAIDDKKLWHHGPVKVIPPPEYKLEPVLTYNEILKLTLQQPWAMAVRKVGKHLFQFGRAIEEENSTETEHDDLNKEMQTKANLMTSKLGPKLKAAKQMKAKTLAALKKTGKVKKLNADEDFFNNNEQAEEPKKWTVFDLSVQGQLPERLENSSADEIAKDVWNTIRSAKNNVYGKPISLYGHDQDKVLSPYNVDYLSLAQFNTPLTDVCRRYGFEYSGIATAFAYFGAFRASFPFHIEDQNMFAINFLHYGATKSWFGSRPKDFDKIETLTTAEVNKSNVLRKEFQNHKCDTPFREKVLLPDPEFFRKNHIPLVKHHQEVGEFIIVGPKGGHMGFNQGFNVAEALNFVNMEWVYFGLLSKGCKNATKLEMTFFVYELIHHKFNDFINGTLMVYSPTDETKTKRKVDRPIIKIDKLKDYQSVLDFGIQTVFAVATLREIQIAYIKCHNIYMWIRRDELATCEWVEKSEKVTIPDYFYNTDTREPPPLLINGVETTRKASWGTNQRQDNPNAIPNCISKEAFVSFQSTEQDDNPIPKENLTITKTHVRKKSIRCNPIINPVSITNASKREDDNEVHYKPKMKRKRRSNVTAIYFCKHCKNDISKMKYHSRYNHEKKCSKKFVVTGPNSVGQSLPTNETGTTTEAETTNDASTNTRTVPDANIVAVSANKTTINTIASVEPTTNTKSMKTKSNKTKSNKRKANKTKHYKLK